MHPDGGGRGRGGLKDDAARRERLAAELRENLKRRKARARALGERRAGDEEDPDAAAGDGSVSRERTPK
jgi:hypothetical protein